MIDYFELLRVAPDADAGRVRAAYEQLVAAHDRGEPGLPSRAMLDEAFAVLSDDGLRERYVRLRAGDGDAPAEPVGASEPAAAIGGRDLSVAAGLVGGALVGGLIAGVAALVMGADPLIGGGVGVAIGAVVGAAVRP